MTSPEPVHMPYYNIGIFCGYCPDCGLEHEHLVVNAVQRCDDCPCEFTFSFDQLEEISRPSFGEIII